VYNTALWFSRHLEAIKDLTVFVLTATDPDSEDKEKGDPIINFFNKNEPKDRDPQSIQLISVHQFVQRFSETEEICGQLTALADSLSLVRSDYLHPSKEDEANDQQQEEGQEGERKREKINALGWSPHRPSETIEMQVKSGVLFSGTMRVSETNYHNSFLQIGDSSQIERLRALYRRFIDSQPAGGVSQEALLSQLNRLDRIIIPSLSDRNRSIHGDQVAVELFPHALWTSSSSSQSVPRPCGRVVGVIQRNWRLYVATLQINQDSVLPSSLSSASAEIFVPLDNRIPKVSLPLSRSIK